MSDDPQTRFFSNSSSNSHQYAFGRDHTVLVPETPDRAMTPPTEVNNETPDVETGALHMLVRALNATLGRIHDGIVSCRDETAKPALRERYLDVADAIVHIARRSTESNQ